MIRNDIELALELKHGLQCCTDEAYASDIVTTKMPGVVEQSVFDVQTVEGRSFRVTVEPRIGVVSSGPPAGETPT